MTAEVPLRGLITAPVRAGQTVPRPAVRAADALLTHLAAPGFTGAPRYVAAFAVICVALLIWAGARLAGNRRAQHTPVSPPGSRNPGAGAAPWRAGPAGPPRPRLANRGSGC